MSETIAQINTAALGDTWQIAIDKMNQSLNAISTVVVSVNSHANGGLTTGNGFVEGTFGARNLVGNTISGGTVATPGILTISSNVELSGDTVTVGNVVINSTTIAIDGVSVALETGGAEIESATIGTSAQIIDYWDKFVYRSADYTLTIQDDNANAFQASRLLVLHDGGSTNAYYSHYAVMWSNTSQGDFSANANSTHIKIYLTPTSANATIRATRGLISL